jgi:hypothetical protein
MSTFPAEKKKTDLSEKELARVKEFIGEGCPGLVGLKETDFLRMCDLYVKGSTYSQISVALNISKNLILYLSHTYEWHLMRQEVLGEMQDRIRDRIVDSRLETINYLIFSRQIEMEKNALEYQRWQATKDPKHLDNVTNDQIIKITKMLEELNVDPKKAAARAPAFSVNVGDGGATIERTGENKLTITPKADGKPSEFIKKLAEKRRAEQNKSDIEIKQTPNKEEKDEN